MALLKSHDTDETNGQVKGIGKSTPVLASFFLNDPLVAGNTVNDNKPGRSIPSMFARMKFFQSAFEAVKQSGKVNIGLHDAPTVYHRMVSACLDIIYLVFKRDSRLKVLRWDYNGQKNLISNNNLKTAIEAQRNSFLAGTNFRVNDIYLFFLGDKLIGGTSPFTFAYSSPDWNGLGEVKSLRQRDDEFREYIYKLYCAYHGSSLMKDFLSYVELCKRDEPKPTLRNLDPADYAPADLDNEYSQYETDDELRVWVCQQPEIRFYAVRPESFTSDFYLDSPLYSNIDTNNSPLFICEGYHDMFYVNTVKWDSDTRFESQRLDNNDVEARKLPGNDRRHRYLSQADFLDDKLICLPYNIDTQKFKAITKDGKSYLLPLRPMFFKYFPIDRIEDYYKCEIDGEKCIITLTIPVRSVDGVRRHQLTTVKEYSLISDVTKWTSRESVNIGIFPFCKISNGKKIGLNNRYIIVHNINGTGDEYSKSTLMFYNEGDNQPVDNNVEAVEVNDNTKAIYYHLNAPNVDNCFDYIRLCWNDEQQNDEICGTIIPIFPLVTTNGNDDYVYAIDFGTTNSHVAFKSSTQGNPTSFSSEDLRMQVGYLNVLDDQMKKNNEILLNERRNFIPHFSDNTFTFPFRTASKVNSADDTSKLFSGVAIGFNYPNELTQDGYEADLKWKMEKVEPDTGIKRQAKLFFEELLWIVKNHWLSQQNANKTHKPKIVITYPQAMTQSSQLLKRWKEAYKEIFEYVGKVEDAPVNTMIESLAPCFGLINTNAIGNNALLNIDIGGGTTDLQYYRRYIVGGKVQIDSFHTSVLFAGDDLWGKQYEHVGGIGDGAADTNNFKQQAATIIGNVKIDGTIKNVSDFSALNVKEFISVLIRDQDHQFTDWLSNHGNVNVCRTTLFLHYSAIIYYSAMWLKDNGMQNPAQIQFTGLGSKYIDLLFSDNNRLAKFTEEIICRVTGENCSNLSIVISANPKHATAEGATLYHNKAQSTEARYHLGIDEKAKRVKGNELANYENDLMDSIDAFLATYNSLSDEIDNVRIPKLSNGEVSAFMGIARTSLQEMINYYTENLGGEKPMPVNDPMFFWPFKGALSKLT